MKSSITKALRFLLAGVVGTILFSGWCLAASLTLVEESPGHLRIEANGLENAAAFDLLIQYDPTTIHFDSASTGTLLRDTLLAANTQLSGKIHIAAVNAAGISGSGTLVRIAGSGSATGQLTSFQAKVSDPEGNRLPIHAIIPSALRIATSASPSAPETTEKTNRIPVGDPTLTQVDNTNVESANNNAVTTTAQSAPSGSTPISVPSKMFDATEGKLADYQYQPESALDRLRQTQSGSRKIDELAAAFIAPASSIRQEPELVLSDGETVMTIFIPMQGPVQPNLALNGARLLNVTATTTGEWQIKLLPTEGTSQAGLIILYGNSAITLPLTVAPPLQLDATMRGDGKTLPRLDLDGDGVNTITDDYTLLANLLYEKQVEHRTTEDKEKKQ